MKNKKFPYRSRGEHEIAKLLKRMDISFEYEFPIAIIDDEAKTKLWYPDFYLKEYQIVIEYFGMYNHNEDYKKVAEHKKEVFKKCGIQFLPVYELKDNWEEYILKTLLSHLEHKVTKMTKVVDSYYEGKTKKLSENVLKKLFAKFKR